MAGMHKFNVNFGNIFVIVLLATCSQMICGASNCNDAIALGCKGGQCGKVYCNNDTYDYMCSNVTSPPKFPTVNCTIIALLDALLEEFCPGSILTAFCSTTVQPTTTDEPTTTVEPTTTAAVPTPSAEPNIMSSQTSYTRVPEAATAMTQPVTTQTIITQSQPAATTQDQPVATQAQPVATQAQPVATQAQLITTQAQPVATKAQPVATQSQPVTTKAQPVATQAQPVTAPTQSVTQPATQPPHTTTGSIRPKSTTTPCVGPNCVVKSFTVKPLPPDPVIPTDEVTLMISVIIASIVMLIFIIVFIALLVARTLKWKPMGFFCPCCFKQDRSPDRSDPHFSSAPTSGRYRPEPGTRLWAPSFSRGQP
ncbi:mucin-2-like [Patiria miniata]|uniref:Uncharacterized protein n=1 Tax=Patiria miniata TaxID=46514 RepID=A0A914BHZ7_PATMI|nr:mucin-2-like [Patiria miniata]